MLWYILIAAAVVAAITWRLRSHLWGNPTGQSCRNWKAFHDRTPGPTGKFGTLRVTGECTFPTSGYSVELRRHEPQGINPTYLVLDKIIHKPTGIVTQVITVVSVHYAELTEVNYAFVTILPDELTISVAVPRVGAAV